MLLQFAAAFTSVFTTGNSDPRFVHEGVKAEMKILVQRERRAENVDGIGMGWKETHTQPIWIDGESENKEQVQ